MHFRDIYTDGQFGLSVEIFPPKTPAGDADLSATLETLAAYRPAFVSCTYGAGGSTRDRTIHWCRTIQERLDLPATAHFTCVGSSRAELLDWLGEAERAGVKNIMALRGDAPQGADGFVPAPDGLKYASELVTLIKEHHPRLSIGVAGYPETHQEAPSFEVDLDNLRRKVACGADAVYTQLFFVNDNFFRFQDAAVKAGIDVPIIPGIMPVTSFARIKRITALCGAIFPPDLAGPLETAKDDASAQFEIGVNYAIEQCRRLIDAGVPGMHFYVLNKSQACGRIFDALGLGRPPRSFEERNAMPSPFPGMDPYLENPNWFPELNNSLACRISAVLNSELPEQYYAQLDIRPEFADEENSTSVITTIKSEPYEIASVKIHDTSRSKEVVTAIELLTPFDKRPGFDRDQMMRDRSVLLSSRVSLVEIDLLRTGSRLWQCPELIESKLSKQDSDYRVTVNRAWQRKPKLRLDVFPVALRGQLPTIAVPLSETENELPLDLQYCFQQTYDAGPYRRGAIDYSRPPEPPLPEEHREWAAQRVEAWLATR